MNRRNRCVFVIVLRVCLSIANKKLKKVSALDSVISDFPLDRFIDSWFGIISYIEQHYALFTFLVSES